MGRKPNRGSKRTHVLGGCQNCRRRHTKCDQVQPKCLTCQAVGLECSGYDNSVQWVSERSSSAIDERSGTRRHLYSEQSRRQMSAQLIQQIGSVDNSLATLDLWPHELDQGQRSTLAIGPFSVIDFSSLPKGSFPAQASCVQDTSSNLLPSPSSLGTSAALPDYLEWSDLFDLEFETWLGAQPNDFGVDNAQQENQKELSIFPLTGLDHLADAAVTSSSKFTFGQHEELRKEATFLIKHFSETVISTIAAMPFSIKSPWKILNVSNAVQTYADMTYLNRDVKHANAANLYGILACSAYHLGNNPSSTTTTSNPAYWVDLADRAKVLMKEHLQQSLQRELHGPEKAKYKDQLMALLCALSFSIMAGHQKDTRCYMVDAERLLRLRGLAKRHISRKARLLHHMYTWNRIVGESTYVLHDQITVHGTIRLPNSNTALHYSGNGHNAKLDDFLRIDDSDGHEIDPTEQKAPEIGLHDIHLEDVRDDPATMYLQIYGIPETWLSLLSQTTRTANAAELGNSSSTQSNPYLQRTLEKKAARLEDMICSFVAKSNLSNEKEHDIAPSQHMLRALNAALIIYFYRRIRNVNCLILQSYVDEVISALRAFDRSLLQVQPAGPGTAWPAFVAGCEASAGLRRDFLLTWLDQAFSRTGLQPYKSAHNMVQELGNIKDGVSLIPPRERGHRRTLAATATWMDISRMRKEWVVLC